MNRRDMKKEMYWSILVHVFDEKEMSDAVMRRSIELLSPDQKMTEAADRRYESLVTEIMAELRRKGGE